MSTYDRFTPPESFYREMAKHCDCCPECSNRPCDGVCAGGLCDNLCWCSDDDEPDEDEDYEP